MRLYLQVGSRLINGIVVHRRLFGTDMTGPVTARTVINEQEANGDETIRSAVVSGGIETESWGRIGKGKGRDV